MQPTGNLISAAAEFAAGMKNRKDDGDGGKTCFFIYSHRYTPAVITHGNNITGQNFNINFCAESCQRLINRIVNNLIDKVVQTSRAC